MKIWIVNPFDGLPGESLRPGRYISLANVLVAAGHNVTWWSSNFSHATKTFRSGSQVETGKNNNPRIVLLETPAYEKNISLRRLWNHYVYAKRFKKAGARAQEIPDVIIASCPPLLSAKFAGDLARKFGARVVVDVQDLWPEVFELAFPSRIRWCAKVLLWPLRSLANRSYDGADALTAVSHTLLRRAMAASNSKTKPGVVLPLGVDIAQFDAGPEYENGRIQISKKTDGEFWAVYAGNIGKVQDISTILGAAARLLHSHPNIKFLIVGDGPASAKMRARADSQGLRNVTFTGWVSYPHLIAMLQVSDVGLSTFIASPIHAYTLPNKIFDYMAAGLPMVNSVEGDLGNLVQSERIGLQYKAGDSNSLADRILELYQNPEQSRAMGLRGRKLVEDRFEVNKVYPKFEGLIQSMAVANDGS